MFGHLGLLGCRRENRPAAVWSLARSLLTEMTMLVPSRYQTFQTLSALRELRDATVETGCDQPLVPYPSPREDLCYARQSRLSRGGPADAMEVLWPQPLKA